jgi:hypothetical protein
MFNWFRITPPRILTASSPSIMGYDNTHSVITDLTIKFYPPTDTSSTYALDPWRWQRLEKDLYLHTSEQTAWLYFTQKKESQLTSDDIVVLDIKIGKVRPSTGSEYSWESRPGGIWLLRSNFTGKSHRTVTAVDVLFGEDAVDPRPQWSLVQSPLQINTRSEVPVAKLTVRHGKTESGVADSVGPLKTKDDGTFKIVQISDTHMVTGVGVCKDAVDAHGQPLPESEADPLTVKFLGGILDIEKPDLVVFTGDQLHHDILDSQSTLFKVVAPIIERSIPYAAVFGNHDDEGAYALSREWILS